MTEEENWIDIEIEDAKKRYDAFSELKKKHFERIRKAVYRQ